MTKYVNPYLGAGYLHTERRGTIIGVNTIIKGENCTVLGGVELPLYKSLYGYVDASGTAVKLKKAVVRGTAQAITTVKYSPVTVYCLHRACVISLLIWLRITDRKGKTKKMRTCNWTRKNRVPLLGISVY